MTYYLLTMVYVDKDNEVMTSDPILIPSYDPEVLHSIIQNNTERIKSVLGVTRVLTLIESGESTL